MSGGALDYFCYTLEDHVGDFKDKELDDLVKDLAELFHDREWYLSGDTGEGDWNEARDKFKERWFTDAGRQERIEKYIHELTEDVRRSFGLSPEYCQDCEHWTPCAEKEGPGYKDYGHCDFEQHCLQHRKEYCDLFEKKYEQAEDDPPIFAPVVPASWVFDGEGFYCSKCQYDIPRDEITFLGELYAGNWEYCPSCGAKMGAGLLEEGTANEHDLDS